MSEGRRWHLRFVVEGAAVPKQSFRLDRFGGKYQDERVVAWQSVVAWEAVRAMRAVGLERTRRPLGVSLVFYLPSRRRVDADNLSKGVLDALNGVLWEDDRQVMDLRIRKRLPPIRSPRKRGEGGEVGRVEISVWELGDDAECGA